MCPSSHDDVYIYFNVSRQLFFYSYVIIPATINHNNVNTITGDLYINRQFVVLHTFTQTLFHAHHSREMQEIFRCALNNKRQYFIEPFLISVSCKRDHVCRWFRSNPLILLIAFNHSYRRIFLSDRDSRYALISNWSLYYIDSGTQHHNKMIYLSSLCRRICAVNLAASSFCFVLPPASAVT